MRYLVTAGILDAFEQKPYRIAPLTIDMPDDYDLYKDSEHNSYSTLKSEFQKKAAEFMYLDHFTDRSAHISILAVSPIPVTVTSGKIGGLFDAAAGSKNADAFK